MAAATWERQPLPADIGSDQISALYPPVFESPENGWLALVTLSGETFQAGFYSTSDGGQSWTPVAALPLGSRVGLLPVSLLDPHDLLASVPNDTRLFQMGHGGVKTLTNQDGLSANIVDLQMVSPELGWAEWNTTNCQRQVASDPNGATDVTCSSETRLIKTADGGLTWETIPLPGTGSKTLTHNITAAAVSPQPMGIPQLANTRQFTGQGFDACTCLRWTSLRSGRTKVPSWHG